MFGERKEMSRYDLVMFDMDGTLMDSRAFHQKVFYRFLNRYVGNITEEEVRRGIGATVREIFDSAGVPEENLKELFAKLDEFCRTQVMDLAGQIPVIPGAYQLLEGLKSKGIPCGLLTNSMQAVTENMLKAKGLWNFFAGVSGADYFSVNKIERCRKLQKRLHGEKVLYVGDTEMDIELADCMGYDSCLAKTGYGWYEDETYILQVLRPDYVVLELKEILKFV